MGLLNKLFGISQPQQITLTSILPQQAVDRICLGILPTLQPDKLVLGKGEICHYVDVAVIITEKKEYISQRLGGSYHMWKGFTVHSGGSHSIPIFEPEYTNGILFITNKRIVFVAKKFGFDKKLDKLSAVTPYSDGIDFQFGDKTFALFVPDGTVPKQTIDLLI